MTSMQAEDVRTSLLFVGDLNFGSATTNHDGVAAIDFAIVGAISWLSALPVHVGDLLP